MKTISLTCLSLLTFSACNFKSPDCCVIAPPDGPTAILDQNHFSSPSPSPTPSPSDTPLPLANPSPTAVPLPSPTAIETVLPSPTPTLQPSPEPLPAQQFKEDFDTYNPKRWVPLDKKMHFFTHVGKEDVENTGAPQTLEASQIEGRNTLHMQTIETPAMKRRGIVSQEAVKIGNSVELEMQFRPTGKLDGIAELWLIDPITGKAAGIAIFADNYANTMTVWSNLDGDIRRDADNSLWKLNEWLIFRVSSTGETTRMELLDRDNKLRWSYTYAKSLAEVIPTGHIVISQFLGRPYIDNWEMNVSIDSVELKSIISSPPN